MSNKYKVFEDKLMQKWHFILSHTSHITMHSLWAELEPLGLARWGKSKYTNAETNREARKYFVACAS